MERDPIEEFAIKMFAFALLAAMAEGVSVFSDLPLESVYSPSWNLLRLTGRGFDASLEAFSVSATPDSTVFIMR